VISNTRFGGITSHRD